MVAALWVGHWTDVYYSNDDCFHIRYTHRSTVTKRGVHSAFGGVRVPKLWHESASGTIGDISFWTCSLDKCLVLFFENSTMR